VLKQYQQDFLDNLYSSILHFWNPTRTRLENSDEISKIKIYLSIKVWAIRNHSRITHFLNYFDTNQEVSLKVIQLLNEIKITESGLSYVENSFDSFHSEIYRWIEQISDAVPRALVLEEKIDQLKNVSILTDVIINIAQNKDLRREIFLIKKSIAEYDAKVTLDIKNIFKLTESEHKKLEIILSVLNNGREKLTYLNETNILERLYGTHCSVANKYFLESIDSDLTESAPFSSMMKILDFAKSYQFENILDVGSGNGTLCILLSNILGIPISGVEINPSLSSISKTANSDLNSGVNFINEDIKNVDIDSFREIILFSSLSGEPLMNLLTRIKESKTIKLFLSVGYVNNIVYKFFQDSAWCMQTKQPKEELDILIFTAQ
jgi:hypothetical protein